MLILMKRGSAPDELQRVLQVAESLGLEPKMLEVGERSAVRLPGPATPSLARAFADLSGVDQVLPVDRLLDRVLRARVPGGTAFAVGSHVIGDGAPTIIAGPCAVEPGIGLAELATRLADSGADLLRGGAFKPRTSPYDFQGLGEDGLRELAEASQASGLPVVTEAVDEASLARVEEWADVIQIGARNMQNYALLKRAGVARRPIFLKRGMSASFEEFLLAAEYILEGGNQQVILCERGIRTFSDHSRYTLDLSIVPLLKARTHLPVIVDPSHASGRNESVAPLARAAIAAGADGVMVEVHPDPSRALCDGPQSLRPEEFARLAVEIRQLAELLGRHRETVH